MPTPSTTARRRPGKAARGTVDIVTCRPRPAAFEDAVRQIAARRWLGLTATPYRRDELGDLYLDNFCS